MKLDKKLHETHAKRLAAILNSQSTFAPHINRPEFVTILKLELNTLNAIEKILPEDKLEEKLTSQYLTKEFNTLTKSEFKLGDKFKYEDNDDLIDNINYLPTYCKNIFKVNIDDVVEGKKVTASNPNIDLRSKPEMGDDSSMDAAAAFNMGAMGYTGGGYENPFLMGKAYAKLNKDIAEGKVYQYKTKPRIIVICKYILTVLLALSVIALIVTSIFAFMAHAIPVNADGVEKNPIQCGTILKGVFYIIVACFGGYAMFPTIKSLVKHKGKHNENALYQFSWFLYIGFIILGLMVSLFDISFVWCSMVSFVHYEIADTATTTQLAGMAGWKIGIILSATLTGLCLVPTILGIVFAPKQDKGKIETLLKQYVDEAIASVGGQPHAEVQKPVDVKPSTQKKEDKKEDKKESSDTKPKK